MIVNCDQLSNVLGARKNYIPYIFSYLGRTWPHVVIYVTIKCTKEDESNVSKKKRKRGMSIRSLHMREIGTGNMIMLRC